ncbi:hypothetical protein ABKV19_027467 [Rosa sericea]
MAATVVPSVMVNVNALNRYNYDHWFFWVETYLLAEDLWDVVEGTNKPPKPEDPEFKAWRKNNARALQAIIIFCGEDAESFLKGKTAKEAWNILEKQFKPYSKDTSEVDSNDSSSSIDGHEDSEVQMAGAHASFFSAVRDLNWEAVKEFIGQKRPLIRAKSEKTDKTALHLAVQFKSVTGVKMLLPFTLNKDLEMVDRDGHTPLSMAILEKDTDEMIEIAKCIVEKNTKLLLHIVDPSTNTIPLLMALSLDRPKMTRYLYRNTPLEKLKKRDRAELLSTSFRVKLLDISWDLIQRFPCLATAQDHSGIPVPPTPTRIPEVSVDVQEEERDQGNQKNLIREGIHVPLTPTRIPEVSVDVQKEERDQGNQKNLIREGIHVPPTPTRIPEVSVDGQKEERDQGNQKNLIRKVSCFFGGLVDNLLHLSGITRIYQMKLLHVKTIEILECMLELLKSEDDLDTRQQKLVQKALFQAVERGHAPFIYHLLKPNPRFLAMTDEHDKTVFQFAVERRQDEIFNLIHEFDEQKRKDIVGRKDKFGNNMLHVVGRLSPLTQINHIRGAALQMQKELQWFKKVEGMASPKDLNCINSEGRTPREEFTVNHRNLMEAGEKSIKETATSSSALVAALIITIMFAATVATPGGIKDIKGVPIHLDTKAFQIFIVADVTSLCTSTTSVMIFLGILTSRFSEEDFLTSLPTKLIIGFLTLFLSVGAMMIAFSSSIFIMLYGQQSIVSLSIVLAILPIASFLWMQFPFLLDIIISTYGFRVFKRRVRRN